MVGRSTGSVCQYTMFSYSDKFKTQWLDFEPKDTPHTDTLLHINSAAGVSFAHTKKYATTGFKTLTPAQNSTPQVIKITEKVYHPSGLFPTQAVKPKFIFPCVFASTGFVKRCATLIEKCSMWDVSTISIKQMSKLQLIEFWPLLVNPIKLLQYALLHAFVRILC